MFGLKYRYLIILALSAYTYINTLVFDFFDRYEIRAPAIALIFLFSAIVLLIWESNRLIEKLISRPAAKSRQPVQYLLLFFLCSLPATFVVSAAAVYGIGHIVLAYPASSLFLPAKLTVLLGFRINLFLHCINSIFFFFREAKEKQLEAEALKRKQVQAQLQQVKIQINPHFLFNNLNVLSALVLNKSEDANQFIENFAEVYRYILKNQDKELVAVKTELEFIKPYLYLLEKRFAGNIRFAVRVDERYLQNHYIVPVALQMLIENAIKHNAISAKKPLTIEIFTKQRSLVVRNNLQPKEAREQSTKIGLSNINQRYKLLSGDEITINDGEGHFEVSLPMLKIENYEVFNH